MKCVLSALTILSLCVCGIGCGGSAKRAEVQGKVLVNGQELKFLKDEEIHVSFVLLKGDMAVGNQFVGGGDLQKDGSFTIRFPPGKSLEPGKYRVGFTSDVYGSEGKEGEINRFVAFDSDNSELIAELTADQGQRFLIDLGKKTINKQ